MGEAHPVKGDFPGIGDSAVEDHPVCMFFVLNHETPIEKGFSIWKPGDLFIIYENTHIVLNHQIYEGIFVSRVEHVTRTIDCAAGLQAGGSGRRSLRRERAAPRTGKVVHRVDEARYFGHRGPVQVNW